MKKLVKYLVALLTAGVTALLVLFTAFFTLGTLLTWSDNDTGIKVVMFVFIVLSIFMTGVSGLLFERCPRANKSSIRVQDMSGFEFEHFCTKWLLSQGYKKVVTTPPTGDYGADLTAYDRYGNKWVFQCKRFSKKVSNSAVQEVVAAKAHYKAKKAGVITNSQLTEKAKQLAYENEVLLYELICD